MPVKKLLFQENNNSPQKYGRSNHAAQCSKSQILTNVIDTIIEINSFKQKCFIIKELLQSEQLKQHIVIIGMNQSLSNSDLYEHRCLKNIKKLYK